MKTMIIEKQLLLEHTINEIQRVTIQEGLQYKNETDGIRAIGPLYVLGSYLDEQGHIQTIKEMIDMDVFAPSKKLNDDDFYIQIGNVGSNGNANELRLEIELLIHGIKDEVVEHDVQEAKALIDEGPTEQTDAYSLLDDCFDDLFEEETSYTTCRLIVAKMNDTYASIAQRYQVDEKRLQACNDHREIKEKTLVRLP